MHTIENQQNHYFAIVYGAFLEDERTNHYHHSMWSYLQYLGFGKQAAFPSMKTIAKVTGMSENKARKVLQELQDMGYLTIEARYEDLDDGKKRQTSNNYILHSVYPPPPPHVAPPLHEVGPNKNNKERVTSKDVESESTDSTSVPQSIPFETQVQECKDNLDPHRAAIIELYMQTSIDDYCNEYVTMRQNGGKPKISQARIGMVITCMKEAWFLNKPIRSKADKTRAAAMFRGFHAWYLGQAWAKQKGIKKLPKKQESLYNQMCNYRKHLAARAKAERTHQQLAPQPEREITPQERKKALDILKGQTQ